MNELRHKLVMLFLKVIKLLKLLPHKVYRDALFHCGVAPVLEHGRLLKSLNCKTIVDIGANRGQFALVSRRSLPEAKIFSFEPLSVPAELFKKVFSKDNNVVLNEVAIGPIKGNTTIHISKSDDSSSLLPISDLQNEMFPGTREVATAIIKAAPLDCFLQQDDIKAPALLKLDVQGFEYEALQGCDGLFDSFKWIYCECSFVELYSRQKFANEIIGWLSDKGFRLKGIYNVSYDKNGLSVQADILFENER